MVHKDIYQSSAHICHDYARIDLLPAEPQYESKNVPD